MIVIFAKLGTTEKVIIESYSNEFTAVAQKKLNELGGQWVKVDDLKFGEMLEFSDDQKYEGFNPDINRYSNQIAPLIKIST